MRKIFIAVIVVVATVAVLNGCSKSGSNTNCSYDPCAAKAPANEITQLETYLSGAVLLPDWQKDKYEIFEALQSAESQIVAAIKKQESGVPVKEISRELGINQATFYNWKAKYGGMEVSDVKKMKDMEAELSQLEDMLQENYQSISMDKKLRDLVEIIKAELMDKTPIRSIMKKPAAVLKYNESMHELVI
ncbi:transposase [Ostertagia ostertagi]